VEEKAAAFDLIAEFVRGTPFQVELASIVRPAFHTATAEAHALNTHSSLVHRATTTRSDPLLMQTVKSSPAMHHPKPHQLTTAQLQDANAVLNRLVPANSAHVRKSYYSIIGLYRKYVELVNSPFPPLSEDYFRQLVRELHIICHVEAPPCTLCNLWNSTNCGASLSADIYARCEAHFRTMKMQVDSYYNFMDELQRGRFGERMFHSVHPGALIVFDFGQLDPSTKRHKDGVMHFWLAPEGEGSDVRSIPFHFIGDEASEQPASVAFAIDCIKRAAQEEVAKDLELLVFFSDGGKKEFNSDLIASLPQLEHDLGKMISWNYWASNHGAGVADTDQQNARESLKSALSEKKVINEASAIVKILQERQPNAKFFDASSFRRDKSVCSLADVRGINNYHCFRVENGDVVGYEDSWTMANRRVFSRKMKHLTPQQEYLKSRYDSGLDAKYCKQCDEYYVDAHSCKRAKEFKEKQSKKNKKIKTDKDNDNGAKSKSNKARKMESKRDLDENNRRKIDVYHRDGLWYCGKLREAHPKTSAVDFHDGDYADRVPNKDILDCIHNPQLIGGSDRGLPDYLKVQNGK
jgi:hypothetical protein